MPTSAPPNNYIILVVSEVTLVSFASVRAACFPPPYAIVLGSYSPWPGDSSGRLSYSCFTQREGERAGGSLAGWLGVRATEGKQRDSGGGGLWRQKPALSPSPAHAASPRLPASSYLVISLRNGTQLLTHSQGRRRGVSADIGER